MDPKGNLGFGETLIFHNCVDDNELSVQSNVEEQKTANDTSGHFSIENII